jgi:hypothetical protein
VSEKISGWYIRENPDHSESFAYRCTGTCQVTLLFAPEEKNPKAFCCGAWRELPKLGWLERFPREKAPRYRATLLTLNSPNVDGRFEQ